jgi:signal peptidase II
LRWHGSIQARVMTEPGRKRRLLAIDAGTSNWLWLSLLIILFDQWSKQWILESFSQFQQRTILPFLDIVRWHNEGAAWSLLSNAGGWQRWFFIVLGIGVSLAIMIWLRRLPARGQARVAAGLALILGGALGNVVDRVRLGYVVDFVKVHYRDEWVFPAFNIADSAITVGAGLLILDSILSYGKGKSA